MSQNDRQQAESYLLIVEDSPALLRMLTDIMQDEGFTVVGCSTASAAMQNFDPERIGVAVVDLRLPDLSDLDLLHKLFGITDQIPVIINTAYSSYETAKEAVNLGAFAYVEKAGDPVELVRHVHRAFQYRYKRRSEELQAAVAERTRDLQETNQLLQQEITERKRAEEALREREETIRALVETSRDWIWSIDVHGMHTYCNPAAEEILGYSVDELVGKTSLDLMHEDDRKIVETNLSDCIRERRGWNNLIIRWRHKDGSYRYLESNAVPILNAAGDLTGFRGVDRDITERKQAEKRLRESEAKHRTLVESIPQKVFMKDRNSVFVMCNENFARDIGITPDELVGKADFDFYPQGLAEKYRADDKQIMESDETAEIEEIYLQNGEERIVQIVKVPIHDEQGNVVGIFGIFWDITEQKNAGKRMLAYQEQLQILNTELTLAEEQERRRIALDLHDGVAQTLVSLKMSVDALKTIYHDAPLFGKLRQMGDSLKHAVQDIRTLTFDLSSPTLYELGLEPALAEMLTEQFQEPYRIETEFQDDGQPKPLEDHLKVTLFRAVRELLINVVKHAQAQKIIVRCQRENDHIQITVVDDGVGFDTEKLAERSVSQGGLGLFSIRERLRHIGGDMRIESQPQQGTKVTLLGPLRKETVEAE